MGLKKTECLLCGFDGNPLFCFPRKHDRFMKWLKAIDKELLLKEHTQEYICNNGRLCASHFSETAFSSTLKKRLLFYSVPTDISVSCSQPHQLVNQTQSVKVINENELTSNKTTCKQPNLLLSPSIQKKNIPNILKSPLKEPQNVILYPSIEQVSDSNSNSIPISSTSLVSIPTDINISHLNVHQSTNQASSASVIDGKNPTINKTVCKEPSKLSPLSIQKRDLQSILKSALQGNKNVISSSKGRQVTNSNLTVDPNNSTSLVSEPMDTSQASFVTVVNEENPTSYKAVNIYKQTNKSSPLSIQKTDAQSTLKFALQDNKNVISPSPVRQITSSNLTLEPNNSKLFGSVSMDTSQASFRTVNNKENPTSSKAVDIFKQTNKSPLSFQKTDVQSTLKSALQGNKNVIFPSPVIQVASSKGLESNNSTSLGSASVDTSQASFVTAINEENPTSFKAAYIYKQTNKSSPLSIQKIDAQSILKSSLQDNKNVISPSPVRQVTSSNLTLEPNNSTSLGSFQDTSQASFVTVNNEENPTSNKAVDIYKASFVTVNNEENPTSNKAVDIYKQTNKSPLSIQKTDAQSTLKSVLQGNENVILPSPVRQVTSSKTVEPDNSTLLGSLPVDTSQAPFVTVNNEEKPTSNKAVGIYKQTNKSSSLSIQRTDAQSTFKSALQGNKNVIFSSPVRQVSSNLSLEPNNSTSLGSVPMDISQVSFVTVINEENPTSNKVVDTYKQTNKRSPLSIQKTDAHSTLNSALQGDKNVFCSLPVAQVRSPNLNLEPTITLLIPVSMAITVTDEKKSTSNTPSCTQSNKLLLLPIQKTAQSTLKSVVQGEKNVEFSSPVTKVESSNLNFENNNSSSSASIPIDTNSLCPKVHESINQTASIIFNSEIELTSNGASTFNKSNELLPPSAWKKNVQNNLKSPLNQGNTVALSPSVAGSDLNLLSFNSTSLESIPMDVDDSCSENYQSIDQTPCITVTSEMKLTSNRTVNKSSDKLFLSAQKTAEKEGMKSPSKIKENVTLSPSHVADSNLNVVPVSSTSASIIPPKPGTLVFESSGDIYMLEPVENDEFNSTLNSLKSILKPESLKTKTDRSVQTVESCSSEKSKLRRRLCDETDDASVLLKVKYYQLEMKYLNSQTECKQLKLDLIKAKLKIAELTGEKIDVETKQGDSECSMSKAQVIMKEIEDQFKEKKDEHVYTLTKTSVLRRLYEDVEDLCTENKWLYEELENYRAHDKFYKILKSRLGDEDF